ncbi:hypothetical protein ACF3DV_06600 [Chlorogloeopsis fritschii PCC 9212]|uniref:KOW domain-containing protein n=1 Tax=Chlorogloeopsis fritschii PCC 6912 TaxID=211165 RepID=A0A433N5R2_CHLFR|nr:hypothetical protein [Chlorogloeopsis fritschii]RUR76776.1 hypothetical protein PCC6912_41800 [Chlorogloeopsis fritschii PCC 6912]
MINQKQGSINNFQLGNKVLILHPGYVAGKLGVVCGQECQSSQRWLIRVDLEDIVVSLTTQEFHVLNLDGKLHEMSGSNL